MKWNQGACEDEVDPFLLAILFFYNLVWTEFDCNDSLAKVVDFEFVDPPEIFELLAAFTDKLF